MSALVVAGDTSGTVTLQAPATAGSVVVTLPAASGTMLTTATPPIQSMVRVNGANGYGSTNTAITRWTSIITQVGTDITYTDSATLGGSFTVNNNGVYAISYSDAYSTVGYLGITLNTATPTTGVFGCAINEILAINYISTATANGNVSWTGYLTAGSVIRGHSAVYTRFAQGNSFTITRVA